jgi:hypothetical protein
MQLELPLKNVRQVVNDMVKLETLLDSNPFTKEHFENGNLEVLYNIYNLSVFVRITELDKVTLTDMSYPQFKQRLYYHFKKMGIVHDKRTYMNYVIK